MKLLIYLLIAVGFVLSIGQSLAQSAPSGVSAQVPPSPVVNPKTGPSFPCPQPQDPLAQLICSTPQLALLDMRFVQIYEALYQQVGPIGDPALRSQDVAFDKSVRATCRIGLSQAASPSGSLPSPAPPGADVCVSPLYTRQMASWLSMLQGPALEEASRSINELVAVQRRLQELGDLPSTSQPDGVFGKGTRAAITAWQVVTGRPATGLIGNSDFAALVTSAQATAPVADNRPLAQPSIAPMRSVEQAWVPYIPYAACMSQHGFSFQTFVSQGVAPTDPMAQAAIQMCNTAHVGPATASPVDVFKAKPPGGVAGQTQAAPAPDGTASADPTEAAPAPEKYGTPSADQTQASSAPTSDRSASASAPPDAPAEALAHADPNAYAAHIEAAYNIAVKAELRQAAADSTAGQLNVWPCSGYALQVAGFMDFILYHGLSVDSVLHDAAVKAGTGNMTAFYVENAAVNDLAHVPFDLADEPKALYTACREGSTLPQYGGNG